MALASLTQRQLLYRVEHWIFDADECRLTHYEFQERKLQQLQIRHRAESYGR